MSIRPYRDWRPEIGRGVWIDPAATVIGRVTIGEDASIWPGAVVRGDVNCDLDRRAHQHPGRQRAARRAARGSRAATASRS